MSDKKRTSSTETPANVDVSNWGWFNVFNPRSPDNAKSESISSSNHPKSDFEVVQEDQTTETAPSVNSFAAAVEDNVQINDQYVDLNAYDDGVKSMDDGDDEKDPNHSRSALNASNIEQEMSRLTASDFTDSASPNLENGDPIADREQDPVMISQTLTLKSRNEELEKERAQLQSETLQLKMQNETLQISNEHIIAAQQQEIERLNSENQDLSTKLHDKDEQLKQVQAELARIRRERDNLQKKLDDIVNHSGDHRDGHGASSMGNSAVMLENKAVVYGCISCGQHLFDSSAMVQRQIEIDDHSFGLIVDCLFNVNDVTMGPTVCKTFLNGMFKVRELYCDGCLGTFGWKIIESFDEWNTFHQNKYCVDISNIKQVSHT
jgi:hypothetical protein